MRIGELAALVGVSTRTVRHYHHQGLLPEPVRLANGYREYRLRDAVLLARVRHLAELGLSLDEVRDALADDQGRDLKEMLLELDADLARQQAAIGEQRVRLARMLERADLRDDELAGLLRSLNKEGSEFAAFDREMLTLAGSMSEEAMELLRPLAHPDMIARGHVLYERLDELASADPADPRVGALAADLAEYLPPEMASAMTAHEGPWAEAMFGEMSAAQAEVFRQLIRRLR
ncbi:MerR family transcriptional regulator [Nonomuraea sp. NPDC050556]|uniref:MerR family transcriptional regulator n=1 Tax=Nonomuraea sp. NPDC050556 TaxID=3364369 RepID=UPI0037B495DD